MPLSYIMSNEIIEITPQLMQHGLTLEEATDQIIRSSIITAEACLNIGAVLSTMKKDLKHGEYLEWIDRDLPFSRRTAQGYVKVYEKFNEWLPLNAQRVSYSALSVRSLIALAYAPEVVLEEGKQRLLEGHKLTVKDINSIKQELVPKKEDEVIDGEIINENEHENAIQVYETEPEGRTRNLEEILSERCDLLKSTFPSKKSDTVRINLAVRDVIDRMAKEEGVKQQDIVTKFYAAYLLIMEGNNDD